MSAWPAVLAVIALVGVAVGHHALEVPVTMPSRATPAATRPCPAANPQCTSLRRLQRLRGLRPLDQR